MRRALVVCSILFFAPLTASATLAGCWMGDCNVDPENYEPKCGIIATPSIVPPGGSAALTWSSNILSPFLMPPYYTVPKIGARTVYPTQTTTYTLYDYADAYGLVRAFWYAFYGIPSPLGLCSVVVTVEPLPQPPECSLVAFPSTITQGDSTALYYQVSGEAQSVYLEDSGPLPLPPYPKTVAPSNSKTYRMSVYGNDGVASCTATVTVTPPPSGPSLSMELSPSRVQVGKPVRLAWSGRNVTSCTLTDSFGTIVGTTTTSSSPAPEFTVTRPTLYTLSCQSGIGAVSRTVKVQLLPGVSEI